MVVISYSGKEINAKLVYYGMGLSGKTTNLEAIYEKVPDTSRGKMVSMKTQSDRTLFFDLLPIDLGDVMGFKTRFLLYTVPGQVFYNATRKLVLKGADAIVFVADSERGKMDENKESLNNLRANLAEYKVNLDDIPWVIQYNKRDLPDVYTIEELEKGLNPKGVPWCEAVASQTQGVMETFQEVSKMLIERVTSDLQRSPGGSRDSAKISSRGPAAPPPSAAHREASPSQTLKMDRSVTTSTTAEREAPAPAWSGNVDSGPSYGREIDLPKSPSAQPTSKKSAPESPVSATNIKGFEPKKNKLADAKGKSSPAPGSPAPVATTTGDTVVVPVRLAPGQKLREITLRIVIEDQEAA